MDVTKTKGEWHWTTVTYMEAGIPRQRKCRGRTQVASYMEAARWAILLTNDLNPEFEYVGVTEDE